MARRGGIRCDVEITAADLGHDRETGEVTRWSDVDGRRTVRFEGESGHAENEGDHEVPRVIES